MMKKLIILIVLMFTFNLAQSQAVDSLTLQSEQEMHDFYISKHKKQKKTGLILLGSGVVAAGVGFLIADNSSLFADDDGFAAGTGLFLVGGLTTIASIPVLISSGSNKRKAAAYVQFGEQQLIDLTFPSSKIVSVGVKIDI